MYRCGLPGVRAPLFRQRAVRCGGGCRAEGHNDEDAAAAPLLPARERHLLQRPRQQVRPSVGCGSQDVGIHAAYLDPSRWWT